MLVFLLFLFFFLFFFYYYLSPPAATHLQGAGCFHTLPFLPVSCFPFMYSQKIIIRISRSSGAEHPAREVMEGGVRTSCWVALLSPVRFLSLPQVSASGKWGLSNTNSVSFTTPLPFKYLHRFFGDLVPLVSLHPSLGLSVHPSAAQRAVLRAAVCLPLTPLVLVCSLIQQNSVIRSFLMA